jgi:ClpP class serine protease
LQQLAAIARRAHEPEAGQSLVALAELDRQAGPLALSTVGGEEIDGAYYAWRRGSVGVLPVIGPIFHRANLFTRYSGATANALLARDFARLMADPEVESILMEVDSPGGTIGGTGELANMIYEARGRKPIVAYVPSMAASGGYWIASAADSIVIAESGLAGSLGVVSVVPSSYKDNGEEVVVSRKSPLKWRDPGSETGRAELQRQVDALYEVFAGSVADHRGVKQEVVESDYGQGGLLVGTSAVKAGLADRIGTFEGTWRRLNGGRVKPGRPRPEPEKRRASVPFKRWGRAEAAATEDDDDEAPEPAPAPKPAASETKEKTGSPATAEQVRDLQAQLAETNRKLEASERARVEREQQAVRDAEAAEQRRIGTAAETYYRGLLAAGRCLPNEEKTIRSMHAALAQDDAANPVEGLSRVKVYEGTLNARTPNHLTVAKLVNQPINMESLTAAGIEVLPVAGGPRDVKAEARAQREDYNKRHGSPQANGHRGS